VSQAVSEMIENYLKRIQMMLVSLFKKLFLQHKHVTAKKKHVKWHKTVMVVRIARKLSDCSEQDPANVRYILSRGIRLEERQSKVVIVISPILPLRGKILNVEKATTIKF
jgi:DNA gyrase/topoisomerase IV subunit B